MATPAAGPAFTIGGDSPPHGDRAGRVDSFQEAEGETEMIVKAAVAWLLEEDWPKWRALDSDLPEYRKWRSKTETLEAAAKSTGTQTERIVLRPDTHAEWCTANGQKVGSKSRSFCAAQILTIRSTAN
jgi:hypothetical protein